MRSIPYDKKMDIIAQLNAKKSYRAISAATGVSTRTIGRIAKEIQVEPNAKMGRPKKISDLHARLIARSFYTGQYITAVDASRSLRAQGHDISAQTIRRVLKSSDFDSKIKKSALPLTNERRRNRLRWARAHSKWTVDGWKKVVFSDETKINRLGSDGKTWTWVKKGEPLKPHNVNFMYKGGGGSLMLWSCFTQHGPGFIAKIEGGMDSKLYCEILKGDFMETLKDYGLKKKDVILQQDNDPKHTAKYTKEWFRKNKVNVLDWPSYSPDLNPIENLWFYLKCKLAAYDVPPKNMGGLWNRVADVWYNKVTAEMCMKHIESMPRRIQAVIQAKGGPTKY